MREVVLTPVPTRVFAAFLLLPSLLQSVVAAVPALAAAVPVSVTLLPPEMLLSVYHQVNNVLSVSVKTFNKAKQDAPSKTFP